MKIDEKELLSILKKTQLYIKLINLLDKDGELIDNHGLHSLFEA